jgi:hypothetical protein
VTVRLALAFILIASSLTAQRAERRLEIALPAAPALGSEGPSIASVNILGDTSGQEPLRNGFPTRLHYRLELWRKSGLFDEPTGAMEWDVFVSFDPSSKLYRVVRRRDNEYEDFGSFAAIAVAEAQLAQPYRTPLHPRRAGAYYYNLSVDVQTLSMSDVDAALRWLRGDAQPAVQGRSNPFTAIRNGIGKLVSRVLGGDSRHFVQRSEWFTVG